MLPINEETRDMLRKQVKEGFNKSYVRLYGEPFDWSQDKEENEIAVDGIVDKLVMMQVEDFVRKN